MPVTELDPLALVARVARRGERDLADLCALIRGAELEPERSAELVRAGLLRAGKGRPRPISALIVPLLSLEASLGLRGPELLRRLARLLGESAGEGSSDVVLCALADELTEQLELLRSEKTERQTAGTLEQALAEVEQALSGLDPEAADPAQVMVVAALCANLAAACARAAAPPLRRKPAPARVVMLAPAELAGATRDLVVSGVRLAGVPSAAALERAHRPVKELPRASTRRAEIGAPENVDRQALLERVLAAPDPRAALYAGIPLEQALRHHAALIGLGRERLENLLPVSVTSPGPDPLAWSSGLARVAVEMERAA